MASLLLTYQIEKLMNYRADDLQQLFIFMKTLPSQDAWVWWKEISIFR